MNIFEELDAILSDTTYDRLLNKVFYHGTCTEKAALQIIKNGLKPPKIDRPRRKFAPIPGRVYLTPYIELAQMYSLGADMAGHEIPDSFIKDEGRYGYVFEVKLDNVVDKIQPDEDVVGEMLHYKLNNLDYKISNNKIISNNNIPDWLIQFAHNVLTPNQYKKIYDYDNHADLSAGGKKLLKNMNNKQKLEIAKLETHISYSGNIIPNKTWKIDKTKSNKLKADGSNFFKVAERVN